MRKSKCLRHELFLESHFFWFLSHNFDVVVFFIYTEFSEQSVSGLWITRLVCFVKTFYTSI